jgi:hypothetical protein
MSGILQAWAGRQTKPCIKVAGFTSLVASDYQSFTMLRAFLYAFHLAHASELH